MKTLAPSVAAQEGYVHKYLYQDATTQRGGTAGLVLQSAADMALIGIIQASASVRYTPPYLSARPPA
jgi:hypothetical protein